MANQYSGNVRQDASDIASDCIVDGRSSMWVFPRSMRGQELAHLDAVKRHLRHFGIHYVRDLDGTWCPVDRSVRHPDE